MTARRACIDPATGRLVSPEERPECRALLEERRDEAAPEPGGPDQSAEGLEEERSPEGVKVDLKGRFKQERATVPATPAPKPGGRIAVIDPQTGQLMSGTEVELMRQLPATRAALTDFDAQLRQMMAAEQDVRGLQERQLETGAVGVDLMGRFRSPLVARIGPDGSVVVRHE